MTCSTAEKKQIRIESDNNICVNEHKKNRADQGIYTDDGDAKRIFLLVQKLWKRWRDKARKRYDKIFSEKKI